MFYKDCTTTISLLAVYLYSTQQLTADHFINCMQPIQLHSLPPPTVAYHINVAA
jgi:hypothetical protein